MSSSGADLLAVVSSMAYTVGLVLLAVASSVPVCRIVLQHSGQAWRRRSGVLDGCFAASIWNVELHSAPRSMTRGN